MPVLSGEELLVIFLSEISSNARAAAQTRSIAQPGGEIDMEKGGTFREKP
jgi:hypothetical protein